MDCRFFSPRNFEIQSKLRKQIEKVPILMPRRPLRHHHLACHSHRHHPRRYPGRRRHSCLEPYQSLLRNRPRPHPPPAWPSEKPS